LFVFAQAEVGSIDAVRSTGSAALAGVGRPSAADAVTVSIMTRATMRIRAARDDETGEHSGTSADSNYFGRRHGCRS
jgi:hypothetical protein